MADEGYRRKLTAILQADVEGYSLLMGQDEESTVRTLTTYREVMASLADQNQGRVVDSPGDSMLAEFVSVVDAVKCAVAVQNELKTRNAALPESRRLRFRVGINLGDVIEEGERIYGDGVNVASRVQELADSGGICITRSAYDQVKNKLSFRYDYIGEHEVKNIEEPVRVYRLIGEIDPGGAVSDTVEVGKRSDGWRKAVVAAVVILVVGAAAAVWISRALQESPTKQTADQKAAVARAGKPSIAVLPFDNMSGDPDQEYFSDGITEEIITKLSMNPMLTVIARSSTFHYRDKQMRIQQIGEELRAEYVVEGSVRKAGSSIRITAQLIDAATEGHLWARTYAREMGGIFSLQDEIAQHIAAALNIESEEAEILQARRIPTASLTAYDLFLRSLDCYKKYLDTSNTSSANLNMKAQDYAEKAIEIDPEYAEAHAMLGLTLIVDAADGDPQLLDRASKMAEMSLNLDGTNLLAHFLLAVIHFNTGRYDLVLKEAERIIRLNPNHPEAHLWMGGRSAHDG